jgi:hypothetical protein
MSGAGEAFRFEVGRLIGALEDHIVELFEKEVKAAEERAEEAEGMAEQREQEATYAKRRADATFDLLRDLAEDRHKLGLDMAEEGWTGYGHAGTLRTCADRLCSEAAELLKGGA